MNLYIKTADTDWLCLHNEAPSAEDLSTLNKMYNLICSKIEEDFELESIQVHQIGDNIQADMHIIINKSVTKIDFVSPRAGIDSLPN